MTALCVPQGWDLSFMISAGMLATMVYQLGGGRNGWSLAELIHRVQNMDFWYATVVPRQKAMLCCSAHAHDLRCNGMSLPKSYST